MLYKMKSRRKQMTWQQIVVNGICLVIVFLGVAVSIQHESGGTGPMV